MPPAAPSMVVMIWRASCAGAVDAAQARTANRAIEQCTVRMSVKPRMTEVTGPSLSHGGTGRFVKDVKNIPENRSFDDQYEETVVCRIDRAADSESRIPHRIPYR